MALKDIFKRKKKIPVKKKKEVKEIEKPKIEKEPRIEKEIKAPKPRKRKKTSEFAYRVLKGPHVTEKATDLAAKNQYVFRVFPRANKIEIKKAVEEVYGVNVINVRIINIPRKPKKLGRTSGWKKGYKKAIVKVKQGQKIEIMPR